jgi:hypothetical protein
MDKPELLEAITLLIKKSKESAKRSELEKTLYSAKMEMFEWSKRQVRFLKEYGTDNLITICTVNGANSIVVIGQKLWMNLISGAYLSEGVSLQDVFDPVAKYDLVLDGYLGIFTKTGVRLYTDGYLEPEFQFLKGDEYIVLPKDFEIERLLMMSSYIVPKVTETLKDTVGLVNEHDRLLHIDICADNEYPTGKFALAVTNEEIHGMVANFKFCPWCGVRLKAET